MILEVFQWQTQLFPKNSFVEKCRIYSSNYVPIRFLDRYITSTVNMTFQRNYPLKSDLMCDGKIPRIIFSDHI